MMCGDELFHELGEKPGAMLFQQVRYLLHGQGIAAFNFSLNSRHQSVSWTMAKRQVFVPVSVE